MIPIQIQNTAEGIGLIYLAFLILVSAGMLINKLGKQIGKNSGQKSGQKSENIELDKPQKTKAGIPQKFLLFVGFQIVLYGLSYQAGLGVNILFIALAVGILYEIFLVRSQFSKLEIGARIGINLFFLGNLFSLYLWERLHGDFGLGVFLPLVFLLLAANDSYAQILGEIFKGPKIVPSLSPNKTWSGFLGGGIIVISTASIFNLLLPSFQFKSLIILGVLVWIGGFVGDIIASWVKRKLEIKDFSKLMGASGGVLDRLDSFLFIAPTLSLLYEPLN